MLQVHFVLYCIVFVGGRCLSLTAWAREHHFAEMVFAEHALMAGYTHRLTDAAGRYAERVVPSCREEAEALLKELREAVAAYPETAAEVHWRAAPVRVRLTRTLSLSLPAACVCVFKHQCYRVHVATTSGRAHLHPRCEAREAHVRMHLPHGAPVVHAAATGRAGPSCRRRSTSRR